MSRPITAKPLTRCPQELCAKKPWGRGPVKKVISAGAGLIFKGSGFYITDYRSDKYKEAAKKESAPSGGETKAGESKGESKAAPSGSGTESKAAAKPAAKTEAKPSKSGGKGD